MPRLVDFNIAISYIGDMKVVAWTQRARKERRKLPAEKRARLDLAIAPYAETGAGDAKGLKGIGGGRLRVGDYRIVFTETEDAVEIRAVGHRREIYR